MDPHGTPPVDWTHKYWDEICRHPGDWVAVGPDGILAHGRDFLEVARAADKLHPDAAFTKVPPPIPLAL